MRVLLTGATGSIGRSLAPALVEAGHEVMAGTQRPESDRGRATLVKVDMMTTDSLAAALDTCEAAYYLVHSMETGVTRFRRPGSPYG